MVARSASAPHGVFGRRLALAFAAVAAITALLAALLLTIVWNYQFDQYIRQGLQREANAWAVLLGDGYSSNRNWSPNWLINLPFSSPGRTYVLEAVDAKGQVIVRDEGVGHMKLMGGGAPAVEAQAVVAPIVVGGQVVGTVRVWSTGAGTLISEFDSEFRRAALLGLVMATVVALALASVGGWAYAQRLVRPIRQITETAEELSAGNADARTGLTGHDEIGFLGQTFDDMADAIESDRETERRLTADVAHELRTPLQAIQATVEAMQDGVLPADAERLGTVRDETVRLARLADAILELTRLEGGALRFECERVSLADPVLSAIDTHRALYETVGLTLTAENINPRLVVEGDRDRLQQAVGNLLSNAARYTPEGGTVEVSVTRNGEQAVVSVADSGLGIAEEDLDRVFQRFWRADSARDRNTGGLGIGLAVTREIIERQDGTIKAARRPEGGSVFTISLPLAKPPVAGSGKRA